MIYIRSSLDKHFTFKRGGDRISGFKGGLFSLTSQGAFKPRQCEHRSFAIVGNGPEIRLPVNESILPSKNQELDHTEACELISDIGVPTNAEVVQFTTFLNDACDQTTVRGTYSSRPEEFYTDSPQVVNISDYFSRPIVLTSGGITGNTPFSSYVWNANNVNIQTVLYNFARCKGAFGWRGTLVFRLQVVTTPFLAGIMRLAWSPFEGENVFAIERTNHRTLISQLPGVELDFSTQTQAVLRVPFVHALNYFTVKPSSTPASETLGTVAVYPYVGPNLPTGVNNVPFTLWFSIEDFELIGVAPGEYLTQSGLSNLKKKSPADKEVAEVPGNLSNVLAAGANLMTWAGSKIPFLTAIAGQATWALRIGANIAASYGWAKPVLAVAPIKNWPTLNVYQPNCDAPDIAHNLGFFAENAIQVLPGFAGSNIDEMAFDYIKGVYACIHRGTVTANSGGAYVYSCALSPNAMYYQTVGVKNVGISTTFPIAAVSGLAICPSPLFGLGQLFRTWRGGFKFRIKMAKTRFHTGRYVVGFVPTNPETNGTLLNIPANLENLNYPSMVWDLREGNSIDFEVPFICNQSYLNFNQNFGTFFMCAIDVMQAPATVSQTVDFIVEVAGMSDFEFAVPIEPSFPVAPIDTLYFAQSGSIPKSQKNMPSTDCIGEHLLSVKQIIARSNFMAVLSTSGSFAQNIKAVFPSWLPNATAPTTLSNVRYDYLSYFQGWFGMQRGGYVIHALSNSSNNILSGGIITNAANTTTAPVFMENSGALHIKSPYYSRTSRTIIGTEFALPYPPDIQICVSRLTADTTSRVSLSRRAADDFQFGYFLGCPPLAVPFTSATVSGLAAYNMLTTAH